MRTERLRHACGQPCRRPLCALHDILLIENIEHGERRAAAEWIARIRMTLHEPLAFAPVRIERLIDLFLDNGDGRGHIAARQPLREAHEIGRDARTLARKEASRAPEPRRDLIGDEQDIVCVAEGAQLPEIFLGVDAHPRAPLQERLDDHRRRLVSVCGKGTLRMLKTRTGAGVARFPIGAAIAVGRLDMDVVHHHRLVHLGKEIHTPHGERPDCSSVIPFGKTHKPRLFCTPCLLTVLKRHLERRLYSGRAVIVKMKLRQSGRHEHCQSLRKLNRGTMGEIRKDDVLEPPQLRRNPRIDLLVRMSEEIRPPRTDNIEIALAVHIVEPCPLCVVDHHRRQLFIVLHLRARVPDMAQVTLLNRRHKISPPTESLIKQAPDWRRFFVRTRWKIGRRGVLCEGFSAEVREKEASRAAS